jgi:hypothetical protein
MQSQPWSKPVLRSPYPYPYVYQDQLPAGYESVPCVMVAPAPPSVPADTTYYYAYPYASQQPVYPQCPMMMVYMPQEPPSHPIRPPPPPESAFEKMKTRPEPKERPSQSPQGPRRVRPRKEGPTQKPSLARIVFPGPTTLAPDCRERSGWPGFVARSSFGSLG